MSGTDIAYIVDHHLVKFVMGVVYVPNALMECGAGRDVIHVFALIAW